VRILGEKPGSPEAGSRSPDGASEEPGTEKLQKTLSESFSRTVQEWERVKTKRTKTVSSTPKAIDKRSRSRKMDRSKSRDRDRSKSRREKELHKIEKKEQKLAKEKEKLAKLKQKLGPSGESPDVLSPEFQQKLMEWEKMKGFAPGHLTAETLTASAAMEPHHTRSHSAKEARESRKDRHASESIPDIKGDSTSLEGASGRSYSLPSIDVTPSSLAALSGAQVVDESTSIDLSLTAADNVSSLEAANKRLALQLQERTEDVSALQDELQQLTERITDMDREHNKQISHYKRELWASSSIGHYTVEADLINVHLTQLRQNLHHFQQGQQKLLQEKQHLERALKAAIQSKYNLEMRIAKQTLEKSPGSVVTSASQPETLDEAAKDPLRRDSASGEATQQAEDNDAQSPVPVRKFGTLPGKQEIMLNENTICVVHVVFFFNFKASPLGI